MKKCSCYFNYVMGAGVGYVACALVMLLPLLRVCDSPICTSLVAVFTLPAVAFLPAVFKGGSK